MKITENFITIQQRIMELIDKLPILRTTAKETINEQKRHHDLCIPQEINFSLGDKVLYYKAALDNQKSGKFDEKWKGSYYVCNVGPHGTYRLRDSHGKISKSYVNEILRRRESPENI